MQTTITRKIGGRVFSVDVPSQHDKDLDDDVVADADLERAEIAIASAVAGEGAPTAAGFTFMRKVLGLTGKRLAELLGVRAETVSRWENDAVDVDRAAWLAVGGLVLEKAGRPQELQVRMERLAEGFQPPREKQVEL